MGPDIRRAPFARYAPDIRHALPARCAPGQREGAPSGYGRRVRSIESERKRLRPGA